MASLTNFQMSLFINGVTSGVSETYFTQRSSPGDAAVVLAAIAAQRQATLCADAAIYGGRISECDVKGDSYPTTIAFPLVGTYTGGDGDITAVAGNCLRCLFNGGPLLRGNRFIHYIPKSQYTATVYTPLSGFLTALHAWLAGIADSCCVGTRIKGATVPPFYTLTNYTSYGTQYQDFKRVGRPFGLSAGRRLIA